MGNRRLMFPDEEQIGLVYVRELGACEDDPAAWRELAEARGLIEIPADCEVGLEVGRSHQRDRIRIDPRDLSFLERFQPDDLTYLSIWGSVLDLAPLASLRKLTTLDFTFFSLLGHDLACFEELPYVTMLSMSGGRVDAEALAMLVTLKSLRHLVLQRILDLPDSGLWPLAGIGTLKSLDIYHTKLSDENMRVIATMGQLRKLRLWWTELDDRRLLSLGALHQLEVLYLRGQALSDASFQQLRLMLPRCAIVSE